MVLEQADSRAPGAGCVLVGRDGRGHWVVRDEAGLYGGVFVDRDQALRFAHDEGLAHDPRREEVVFVDRLTL